MRVQVGSSQYSALLFLEANPGEPRPVVVSWAHPFGRGNPAVTMAAARGWIAVEGWGKKSRCFLTPLGRTVLTEVRRVGGIKGSSSIHIELPD